MKSFAPRAATATRGLRWKANSAGSLASTAACTILRTERRIGARNILTFAFFGKFRRIRTIDSSFAIGKVSLVCQGIAKGLREVIQSLAGYCLTNCGSKRFNERPQQTFVQSLSRLPSAKEQIAGEASEGQDQATWFRDSHDRAADFVGFHRHDMRACRHDLVLNFARESVKFSKR